MYIHVMCTKSCSVLCGFHSNHGSPVFCIFLHVTAPRDHLVLVAGQFETFAALLHAHDGNVGQPDLVGRSEYICHYLNFIFSE